MSKKFTAGLNTLLEGPTEKEQASKEKQPGKAGRPPLNKPKTDRIASFVVSMEHHSKLKAVAYWDRMTVKDVLATALEEYFTKYEKKNGPIKEPTR